MRSKGIASSFAFFITVAVLMLSAPNLAAHEGTIPSGAQIRVRTNEPIDAQSASGSRTYSAVVDRDVIDQNGQRMLARGEPAELVVRKMPDGDVAVDLQAVQIEGVRYVLTANEQEQRGGKQGVGANKRTAKYVGGGALLGGIIGAVAGGGKGAAIGALAGGGAGAGAQILTRGKSVRIPAESVLTFRLEQPVYVRQSH